MGKRKAIPFILLFLNVQPISACKCHSPRKMEDAKSLYDYVFHGKVIRVEAVRTEYRNRIWNAELATIVTDSVFKGRVSDTIVLKYQSQRNFCVSDRQSLSVGLAYSIGVDSLSAFSVPASEKRKNPLNRKESVPFPKDYPELDDCSFVQQDSLPG